VTTIGLSPVAWEDRLDSTAGTAGRTLKGAHYRWADGKAIPLVRADDGL